jgi:hypothetical protein
MPRASIAMTSRAERDSCAGSNVDGAGVAGTALSGAVMGGLFAGAMA